ncbi:CdaR family transcriptional regulator [Paenibacillus paeoniae]|uniref:Sugar diacid utilization regulator n=1 Tax=Paenibacillus paeoniae TaxID=2292705 RepID=A0A371P787_9BACL|nr:sugar diacid recognition domain-containing protein [Paenibacillus paeoniae]REK71804.1 hypothetical protein DX130_18970 [Paenibacillus paeoniae]
MRITRKIADMIVNKTRDLTQLNMNVMDKHGTIISSSDSSRIGMLHEGAVQVVRTGEEVMITREQASRWSGSKPGINMPIYFHAEVVGVIGISGQESEVIPFGRAVRMMTELLLHQSYLTEQVEMKERSKMYLVQELIAAIDPAAKDGLYTRGELLGVDLRLPRVLMIIQMDQLENSTDYEIRFKDVAALFPNPQETLIAQLGRGRWMVLADTTVYRTNRHAKSALMDIAGKLHLLLSDWFRNTSYIAVGRVCPDIALISASFHETVSMLEIAKKADKEEAVFHVEDAALELVLAEVSETTARQLIARVLGELIEHPALMETLHAFYRNNMNLNETAGVLGIHRNTLLYRLDRAATFMGEDPRQFQQGMRIQLGLMLHSIHDGTER